jgi:hypothetical protein
MSVLAELRLLVFHSFQNFSVLIFVALIAVSAVPIRRP